MGGQQHEPCFNKHWVCECSCGNRVIVSSSHLVNNEVTQCRVCANKSSATKHGYSNERLYHIWIGMRKRCYNAQSKSFSHYGGRGIYICDEWGAGNLDIDGYLSFRKWSMEHGYADNLSIDRIDVNGPYSPKNCRWVCESVQHFNKTNTVNLTIDGITKPLIEWAHDVGLKPDTIRARLRNGWETKSAVFSPITT